jgi:hypothetical protein
MIGVAVNILSIVFNLGLYYLNTTILHLTFPHPDFPYAATNSKKKLLKEAI